MAGQGGTYLGCTGRHIHQGGRVLHIPREASLLLISLSPKEAGSLSAQRYNSLPKEAGSLSAQRNIPLPKEAGSLSAQRYPSSSLRRLGASLPRGTFPSP